MADNRIIVHLKCTVCKNKNYTTVRNRKNQKGKLELKKYCPTCRKHTIHKESK